MGEDRSDRWRAGFFGTTSTTKYDSMQNMAEYKIGKQAREALEKSDSKTPLQFGPAQTACFPADARILTVKGKRAISSLQRGEYVLSRGESGALLSRRITRVRVYELSRICIVEFDDRGHSLRVTPSHTVLSRRGWSRVDGLRVGDELLQAESGRYRRIRSVTLKTDAEPVYNLITEGDHNFIADGIVAHNFTRLRRVRTLAHRLLFDPMSRLRHGVAIGIIGWDGSLVAKSAE